MRLGILPRSPTISANTARKPLRVRTALLESLQSLVLFPQIGRQQKVEGVRKVVTRRYPYLVYYTADDEAEEIVILAIQHPARGRDHSDS